MPPCEYHLAGLTSLPNGYEFLHDNGLAVFVVFDNEGRLTSRLACAVHTGDNAKTWKLFSRLPYGVHVTDGIGCCSFEFDGNIPTAEFETLVKDACERLKTALVERN